MHEIVLLTNLLDSPSVPILREAAKSMGVNFQVSLPQHLEDYLAEDPQRRRPGFVLTRLGSSASDEEIGALRSWQDAGIPCVNRYDSIVVARDKSKSQRRFEEAGVPCPKSVLLSDQNEVPAAIKKIGEPPWVLKKPVSCQGLGVELVDQESSIKEMILKAPPSKHAPYVLQQFVAEAAGSDTRVLVVGGKAIAAIRRETTSGDFRSNLHLGGTATAVTLNDEISLVAEAAAKAVGLDIAGIDLLSAKDGYLVIEANASPGLRGTQSVTKADLGRCILEFVLSQKPS